MYYPQEMPERRRTTISPNVHFQGGNSCRTASPHSALARTAVRAFGAADLPHRYTFRMTSSEPDSLQSQVASLERRLHCTERWVRLNKIAWTILAVAVIVLLGANRAEVVRAQPQSSQKLRLRELAIVDEKGRERIVIAAPLPSDVVVNGNVTQRVRQVSAAVQFKAPDGTEQGGIAMSDDGSMIVGIDDERGRERAHLYYLPKRGSGVFLQGENAKQTVSLLIPNGGRDATLEMTDQAGKLMFKQPPK